MGLTKGSVAGGALDAGLVIKKRQPQDRVVALAGNPNVGKSTIFNALTGLHQHTGNWPGKTVTNAQGYYNSGQKSYVLVDIPGVYSLLASSAEEEVARDFICSDAADAVIVVCNGACLERSLPLALQTLAITRRAVVCVNLLDEARAKGLKLDLPRLAELLGTPVVGTVASRPETLAELKQAVDQVLAEPECAGVPSGSLASEDLANMAALSNARIEELTLAFTHQAEEIAAQVVSGGAEVYGHSRDWQIDRLLCSRLGGYALMILLLAVIFWLTLTGANYPSALLSQGFFWLGERLSDGLVWLQTPLWLQSLLVQGVWRTLSWVVSVMLPPMAIFFPLFTLLEDVGYLPRIAYNLDRPFQACHACGKQALTMAMGFGCNAAGVIGCRIIDSPRERLLAVLTNNFVPCNGRFPTLIALISMFFVWQMGFAASWLAALLLVAVILLGVGLTFLLTRILSGTILKGEASSFALELPAYRRPRLLSVIVRSIFDRTLFVLGRAAAVAAPCGLLIWLLANLHWGDVSLLAQLAAWLEPLGRWLGMDGVILLAFILGLPANEIVVPIMVMCYLQTGSLTELNDLAAMRELFIANGWTWRTAVCTLLFMLLHWPCSTTLLTIKQETGSWRWTALAFALPTFCGATLCFVAARLLSLF